MIQTCPPRERLERLLTEQLTDAERDDLEGHVEVCTACQQTLESLTGESDSRSTASLVAPPLDAPVHLELVQRLQQALSGHERRDGNLEPTAIARRKADTKDLPPASRWPALPGYEMESVLGQGGMGIVYRARDVRLQRAVALKMLLGGEFAKPDYRDRFQLEAKAAARLQHPNIVQVYDVGDYRGQPYFTLEFMDGGSLQDRLAAKPQPPAQAARWLATLARAVHYAHEQGVVHRDLKPSNVLFSHDGTLKLCDFGVAKVLSGSYLKTASGLLVGTPEYMAPEQAAGKSREAGPAADIYALGAILYTMLTGRPPFQAAEVLDTLEQVRSREPVPPRGLNAKIPRDLETITLKCLDKEPARRFPTARALADDLESWLAGKPIQARPVGQTERLWRWGRRNPVVAGLAGAVFLLLAAVAVVASVGYVREATQRGAAQTAEKEMRRMWYAATISLAHPAWNSGNISQVRALLAETEDYPDRGFEWYFWQRMCHLDLHTLIGHRAAVKAVAWSPDGQRLATGSEDGTAKVWQVSTGRELHTLRGAHTSDVCSVAWSPDGQRLATGGMDGMAKVWDASGGWKLLSTKRHASGVYSVSWSADGQRLATGNGDGTTKVWEPASNRELFSLETHAGPVLCVAWSPDGQRLATGSEDGTANVWVLANSREPLTLTPTKLAASVAGATARAPINRATAVSSVAWSPDGKQLSTGSSQGTATVWEAASGRELFTFTGHTLEVHSVCWSPDGQRLATASQDGTTKVWEVSGNREALTLKGHLGPVLCVVWSPDGKRLATGSGDATAKVWEAASSRELVSVTNLGTWVFSISWSPDGQRRLATANHDGTVKVWEVSTGRELNTLTGHQSIVRTVSWSPDGQRLATGSWDETAKVWDASSGRELFTLPWHKGAVYSVCWSPDGRWLAVGSGDVEAKVWDAATGRELLSLKQHKAFIHSVSWSPDGRRLATGSWDRTAKVWDAASGGVLHTLSGHTGRIHSVCWSPDGRRLATGAWDGTVKVWDSTSGREVLSIKGHTDLIASLAWSPDGRRLATGSRDATAKVWDLSSGRELLSLTMHPGWVNSMLWSADGQRLATGSEDGTVRVWEAATVEDVQQWARQDRAVEQLWARRAIRGPEARGFVQDWLLLLPLPLAPGKSGAESLDQEQLPGEAMLRPRAGEGVSVAGQELHWRTHRSPELVLDFNEVLGSVTPSSVAYAVCYLESERARENLWLQVGSDDQAKVYLNGQEVYQSRLIRALTALDTAGPVALRQGTNVLVFKVVNVSAEWQGCVRLVDDEGLPAEGIRVKLMP
jgi:WD40 repeat protein